MLKFDKKLQCCFVNKKWMTKLVEAGLDCSDASYFIVSTTDEQFICDKDEWDMFKNDLKFTKEFIPTYNLTELIMKMDEWYSDDSFEGSLSMFKDAPFYSFFYKNTKTEKYLHEDLFDDIPLYAAVRFLIACLENNEFVDNLNVGEPYENRIK